MSAHDVLRRVCFRPYAKGKGPAFWLTMWDTGKVDMLGKSILSYRLNMTGTWDPTGLGTDTVTVNETLFSGSDFACSPMHAIDSDECVRALMGFLTLRPGDTDAEYFAGYTAAQREYCEQHAEALSCEVMARFGEG